LNKYGYLVYEDYPLVYNATVTTNYAAQEESQPIQKLETLVEEGYHNWATFEKGEFDFEKYLFTYDPEGKMAHTSVIISDANGNFERDMIITITPDAAYSGSGFTLRTYNNDYTIVITVTDSDGTRSKTFNKTSDEFYSFVYNGLQSVTINFTKVEPRHFLKVIAYQLGTTRMLQEDDFVEEPKITNNFSLTGEGLEYDTLDFTFRGNKEEFNVITGERITYSKTGQRFYVDSATQNNDGTISVSCYDAVSLLDNDVYAGSVRTASSNTEYWAKLLLTKNHDSDISVSIGSLFYENQTFTGYMQEDTFRNLSREFLQGNMLRIKRGKYNKFTVFSPYGTSDFATAFTMHNIIGVPTVETTEQYALIHFSKHRYSVNQKDGKQEVFNGNITKASSLSDTNSTEHISFSEPYSSLEFYYVSGTDEHDADILSPVESSKFTVVNRWNNCVDVISLYSERIVIVGYPFKTNYTAINAVNNDIPLVFKNNRLNISDCKVTADKVNDTYTRFKNALKYIYSFNKIVSLSSVYNANAGDAVKVVFDGYNLKGWITQKTGHMNGVYDYVIACK